MKLHFAIANNSILFMHFNFQESLGKLNEVYKELDEVFNRTKQAFQTFKTKSFFYPEPEFTKPFTESLKQVRLLAQHFVISC